MMEDPHPVMVKNRIRDDPNIYTIIPVITIIPYSHYCKVGGPPEGGLKAKN